MQRRRRRAAGARRPRRERCRAPRARRAPGPSARSRRRRGRGAIRARRARESRPRAREPSCAIATRSSVGSATIAASALTSPRPPPSRCVPTSSSATAVTTTSPASPRERGRGGEHDRGERSPSCRRRPAVQPVSLDARRRAAAPSRRAPTVSRCAFRSSERPPPRSARRRDDVRRATGRARRTRRRAGARRAIGDEPAISASPAPPGTSDGLTESIATSADASSRARSPNLDPAAALEQLHGHHPRDAATQRKDTRAALARRVEVAAVSVAAAVRRTPASRSASRITSTRGCAPRGRRRSSRCRRRPSRPGRPVASARSRAARPAVEHGIDERSGTPITGRSGTPHSPRRYSLAPPARWIPPSAPARRCARPPATPRPGAPAHVRSGHAARSRDQWPFIAARQCAVGSRAATSSTPTAPGTGDGRPHPRPFNWYLIVLP